MTLGKIWESLVQGVRGWLIVATVTAAVGLLIGAFQLSGLAVRITGFILNLSGGNLLATLILIGVASFILGMGLDAIPSYITLATIAAPALIKLGVPDMVAHLYVIYWGLSSFITPPVCLAVYVACGISGSKIWDTGWEAVRLGIAVFVVPFAFVYNRALLLQGTPLEIAFSILTALIGAGLIAAAMRGYVNRHLAVYQRILLFLAGLFFIAPGYITALVGLVVAAAGLIQLSNKKGTIGA